MILDQPNMPNPFHFHQTHRWFFWSAVVMFFCSLLFYFRMGNTTLDIQWNDTYYGIAPHQIFLFLGFIFLAYSIIYFLLNFYFTIPLQSAMSKLHYWLTILCVVIVFSLSSSLQNPEMSFSDTTIGAQSKYYYNLNLLFMTSLSFLVAQLIFLGNVSRSIYLSIRAK